MKRFSDARVAKVFAAYPPDVRKRLLFLRQLIFDVAARTPGVGDIEETLKWGEPAYLTTASRSGSTIRIDAEKGGSGRYAMYFNCQTTLVDTFRTLFPRSLKFAGNRAVVFDPMDRVPVKDLRLCIAMALTYHRDARQRAPRPSKPRARRYRATAE